MPRPKKIVEIDDRLTAIGAQVTDDELALICQNRGFRVNRQDGQQQNTERERPDPAERPITRHAMCIADYAGRRRYAHRWYREFDVALQCASECNVLGQMQAYTLIESRLAGFIDPDAEDSPYVQGRVDALNAVKNLIKLQIEDCEALDEELY